MLARSITPPPTTPPPPHRANRPAHPSHGLQRHVVLRFAVVAERPTSQGRRVDVFRARGRSYKSSWTVAYIALAADCLGHENDCLIGASL